MTAAVEEEQPVPAQGSGGDVLPAAAHAHDRRPDCEHLHRKGAEVRVPGRASSGRGVACGGTGVL